MSLNITSVTPEIENYLHTHFSSEDEFLRQLRHDAASENIPEICISPEQGLFMQFLLKSINAKRVLEIGSLAGYSAITMARALPIEDGKLTAVEINPEFADFIARKANEAGLGQVINVVNKSGLDYLNSLSEDELFDFIFIDADKMNYSNYLNICAKHLLPGGILALDNAFAFGDIAKSGEVNEPHNVSAIRKVNLEFRSRTDFSVCLVPTGDGLIMGVKIC